jgi:hypothetical protein
MIISNNLLENAVVRHLEQFAALSTINFMSYSRWAWMSAEGENWRPKGSGQSRIVQHNNPAGFQTAEARFPILFNDFVVVIAMRALIDFWLFWNGRKNDQKTRTSIP